MALVVALLTAPRARDQIHETDLRIPGAPSARATALTGERFDSTLAMAVLLTGRPALVEREGPQIVAELQQIEGVEVFSPWATGGRRLLRERPGQATLTLQVAGSFREISDRVTPAVERVLDRHVSDGLRYDLTGQAPLMRAINAASLEALDKGELIALPVLAVMLLAIFRSPLAALVPAFAGLLVTRAGTALMGLIGTRVQIDALALSMVAMMGLALGVDYSLLMVSRFREELAAGRGVSDAVEETAAHAGRTVLFAGTALAIGMLCALAISPGSLLVSSSLGLLVATVLAVLVALLTIPALLAVLGANVNRWQIGGARTASPWVAVAERALRRPGAAAFFTLLPLALVAAPALALDTGPPHVADLPPDDPGRRGYERFERLRGGGFAAPFEIVLTARGPITTTERLEEIDAFQRRVSGLRGVEAVLGPAALLDATDELRDVTTTALTADRPLRRLERGLREGTAGARRLRDGLEQGADGAQRLASGVAELASGSRQLADGARQAAPAARELADGIAAARGGADRLASQLAGAGPGIDRLLTNVEALRDSLDDAARNAGSRLLDPLDSAQSAAQAALRALGSAAALNPAVADDPNVAQARDQLAEALKRLGTVALNLSNATTTQSANAAAARALARGVARLRSGFERLAAGSERLADGIARASDGAGRLADGSSRLASGLADLDAGARTLRDGLDGAGGARALADGLRAAVDGGEELDRGLGRMLGGVVRARARVDGQRARLLRAGTDPARAIESGYFVLAAIDGASRQTRANAGFVTNVADGGAAARVLVVPDGGPFDPATVALRGALERETARLAARIGAREAVVGGPAVLLDDFDTAMAARFPWLVALLAAVTFLVLLAMFRSPVLALCAVLLNLVTVGAAVGVLVVCFQGDAPLLGGPGYLDAIALAGLFAIMFGLAIDYEVFLISRLVEGRARTGTTAGAIHFGLERTGTIITGAAFIMAAVFLAFALQPVANTRQFGVGLTVAVLLDATVVRLILLPALVRLFGERTWWTPRWLGGRPARSR